MALTINGFRFLVPEGDSFGTGVEPGDHLVLIDKPAKGSLSVTLNNCGAVDFLATGTDDAQDSSFLNSPINSSFRGPVINALYTGDIVVLRRGFTLSNVEKQDGYTCVEGGESGVTFQLYVGDLNVAS